MAQQELLLILAALVILGLVAGLVVFTLRRRRRAVPSAEEKGAAEPMAPEVAAPALHPESVAPPAPVLRAPDLGERLTRTRSGLFDKLGKFFGRTAADRVPEAEWESLEEALLAGDVGIHTANRLLQGVRSRLNRGDGEELRHALVAEGESLLSGVSHGFSWEGFPKPYVISIVGVNGAGKTTTIGKLARKFRNDGKSVLLAAGDTFRAAAISQLKVWADRTGSDFVTGREGADPGAVAFDSVTAAKARGVDVVLLDTAGRLHTKSNLMEELKKIHRVIKKVIPEAPHETWLILDGTAGQNSILQAKEFQKALELSGVIITKLDGTAKGGAVLSVASELGLPIRFIGVGETADDLVPFQPRPFLEAILGA